MSRQDLNGAVTVITGASSGIGEATALAFARKGASLVLAARDRAALEEVAASCRDLGARVIVVPADVTDANSIKALASRAVAFGGRIDVWVSNVGVGAVGGFLDTPIEAHQQVLMTNLMGHLNDAHAALAVFISQGQGVFINMISLGGFAAAPFAAAYSASKFGLRGFSEALRGEFADRPGIQICDIYPAFVDTPGIPHAANYTGKALSVPPPVLDARRVATTIVDVAERPRPTTTIGGIIPLLRLGHLLAPETVARFAGWFLRTYLDRAPRTQVTEGNLWRPPAVAGGIDGGLRSPVQRGLAVTATVLLAGAGLALLARRKAH
jgi:short-subunit dehydrogenase